MFLFFLPGTPATESETVSGLLLSVVHCVPNLFLPFCDLPVATRIVTMCLDFRYNLDTQFFFDQFKKLPTYRNRNGTLG